VLDTAWTVDGGISLTLKETDASIWALGTAFTAYDPAPNTLLPSPFAVPAVASLACASGTGQLLKQADGSIQTRVSVTWTAVTDALVLESGGVEVRYGLASTAEATWQSVTAERGQSMVYVTENIRDGLIYLVKARAFNALVKGAWCAPVLHQVVGKTAAPANVAGLTAAQVPGGVLYSWTPNTDADYLDTEIRTGASWAAGTLKWRGTADRYLLPWPAAGSLTAYVAHRDTSKTYSATPQSATLTVGDAALVDTAQIKADAVTKVHSGEVLAVAVTGVSGTGPQGYDTVKWSLIDTISFTASFTGDVLLSISGVLSFSGTATIETNYLYCEARVNCDFDEDLVVDSGDELIYMFAKAFSTGSSTAAFPFAYSGKRAVTSGNAYSWKLYGKKTEGTVTADRLTWRVEEIKR
jgi:hypothetical protein